MPVTPMEQVTALVRLVDFTASQVEMWCPVLGYPNYLVSTFGRVRNRARGNMLKLQLSEDGYLEVTLCTWGRARKFRVHRLVGRAFTPNPRNLPQINHLNLIKNDNRSGNLEWATGAQNSSHAVLHKNLVKNPGKYH